MKKILLPILALVASTNTIMAVDDNTVEVSFSGTTATVSVASNISSYITNQSSGSHVKLVQSADFQGNSTGEITYILSGTSTNGEFYLEGSYKCTVELQGLTLTNPSGPALNIQNGKRVKVSAKSGTTSTLADGANEEYNGCLHCKGHTEFKGKGTLNVIGNSRHAIYSKEYVEVKNITLNITQAVKDGIHCKEYFLMESGTVSIKGVEDDGIQVELSSDAQTGQTSGHEDENSGNFYMEDGTLNIAVLDYGGEHVKVDGTTTYGGGTRNFTTTATAINDLQVENETTASTFDLSGRRIDGRQAKGLVIVRQAGKKVKKIVK